MFALSHPTITVSLLNLAIILAVIAVGVATDNPLALLGMLMLRDIPIFEQQQDVVATQEVEEAWATDTKIGFTADL